MAARILVVEDEPAIQALLSLTLSEAGYQTFLASDAIEAYQHTQEVLPDLILLDWMLPGMSGIEFARKLRGQSRTQNIPIIMLTAKAQEQDKLAGLETGADDYMVKPFSTRELNARIKAVLRRRAPQMVEDRVEAGDLVLDPATYRITAGGKDIHMGPTEFKLLHFFMTHPERVYSRIQLLDHVWGDHVFIEERTVDVHIRRLRFALEDVGQDGAVQTVRGVGYRFTKIRTPE